jgi:hypothetical protein
MKLPTTAPLVPDSFWRFFEMLTDTNLAAGAAATEKAEATAAWNRGEPIDDAVLVAALMLDADENFRRQLAAQAAGNRIMSPELKSKLDRMNNARALAAPGYRPAVSTLPAPKYRAAKPAASPEQARAFLLGEIERKHGPSVAAGAKNLSIDDLVKRAAAPTRAQVAASWNRAFSRIGVPTE